MPDLEPCPHCREMKQVHHVCPTCGWYGGREAVKIKVNKEASAS
jgi:large subunit ribosomal protein L32